MIIFDVSVKIYLKKFLLQRALYFCCSLLLYTVDIVTKLFDLKCLFHLPTHISDQVFFYSIKKALADFSHNLSCPSFPCLIPELVLQMSKSTLCSWSAQCLCSGCSRCLELLQLTHLYIQCLKVSISLGRHTADQHLPYSICCFSYVLNFSLATE